MIHDLTPPPPPTHDPSPYPPPTAGTLAKLDQIGNVQFRERVARGFTTRMFPVTRKAARWRLVRSYRRGDGS